MAITTNGNRISVYGNLNSTYCSRLLAATHRVVVAQGYQDIVLDFSQCTRAFSAEMLAVCVRCQKYWKDDIDVNLVMPEDKSLARLFLNTNWAHLIDIRQFEPSRFRGYTHAPALRFSSGKEQHAAVDRIMEILLAAIKHLRRQDLRVMEWAINEITDNVINHSQSMVGGFVQVTNHRQRSQVEFVVGDAGIGVPGSLRPSKPELLSDQEALDAAIREGVTRDKSVGQGNGLYGTWQVSKKSKGSFRILSGLAELNSTEKDGLKIDRRETPMTGTLIACRIGYSDDLDLENELIISGKPHVPTDYIETHFSTDDNGAVVFDLFEESEGFGSRAAGDPVRRKLNNIIQMDEVVKIVVDLERVMLVSSSYADEVFGKLFLELGPLHFGQKIEIRNVDPLVQGLIDKAIYQRMRQ